MLSYSVIITAAQQSDQYEATYSEIDFMHRRDVLHAECHCMVAVILSGCILQSGRIVSGQRRTRAEGM